MTSIYHATQRWAFGLLLSCLATYGADARTTASVLAANSLQGRYAAVQPAAQAAITVTGRVTDENGEGLPGVNVVLKGSTSGTVTNTDGAYSISVPDTEGILVFSFIGYITEEVPVGSRTTIDVLMVQDMLSLNEVVVVGYGTQQRKDVTGSIASITAADFKDMPISNVGQAIQGMMPGVQVQQSSGAPGASPAIRVRGIGSITASSAPLLVVDQQILGGLNDLSFINPNDIERIDVLKDASATAIYGARGSNGVILITTKRGKAGEPRVNLDVYTGFQNVTKKVDMLNTQEYVELAREAYANTPNLPVPAAVQALLDDPTLPYVDYQDLIFRTAPISSYQASVSGGTDKLSYLVSGNYLSQAGIIKTSEFKRYSLRANLDSQLSKRIKVGLSLNPSFNNERLAQTDGHWQNFGVINAALTALPFVQVYQADGVTYNSQQQYNNAQYGFPGVTNAVANLSGINDRQKTTRLLGNAYGELDIIEGLKYRASIGIDVQQQRRNYFQNSTVPYNGQLPPLPSNRIVGFARSQQNLNWLFNQTLNYTRTLGEVHNLNLLLGTEAQKNDFENTVMLANNFPNDVVTTLNAGTILPSNGGINVPAAGVPGAFASRSSFASYFARAGYNFKNKYLFDVSFRTDGSSRFAKNSRWASFPAAAIGWRLSEEEFIKNLKGINNLKVRASYGLTGNAALTSDYGSFAQLAQANYNMNNTVVLGLRPFLPANAGLTWEKSQQADVGLELGLLNDRIFFTADAYNRITRDLLLNIAVPALTGYTSALRNIGKVRNRGMEFGLNTRNLTGAFEWSTNANLSFNRNKVLALGPAGDPIFGDVSGVIGQGTITQIGQPLGSFYGFRQTGIFQDQPQIDAYPRYNNPQPRPGDRIFEDVSGDGRITNADRTTIGNNQPDFTYALTNNFAYKGFDLAVMLQGVQGAEILNFTRRFYGNLTPNYNQLADVKGRWRSAEQPGDGMTPRAASNGTGQNNAVNSGWVENGSYLNVRNVTLGYKLPEALVGKAKIKSARVYAGVQNAYIFTKYKFFNPEVSAYENADPLTIGVDYGSFPQARTFNVGVQVGL